MTIPVSVVLPVHNRAEVIVRAIDSVLKQRPSLFAVAEVVVVDDGSSDGTAARVAAVPDARVRLVRLNENRGACYARNRGVSLASHGHIAFQDSDDVWYEEKLSVLGGFYRPDVDVYFSAFHKVDGGRRKLYPDWLAEKEYAEGELIRHSLIRNPLSTATLLVAKSVLGDAGGFDEHLRRFQDWELVMRIFNGRKVVFVKQPLAAVEVRPDSISRQYCRGIAARLYMAGKHRRLFLRHPFLFLRYLAGAAVRLLFVPFRTGVRR
jgi:teichuronic acid biosynthesis glycosyltransferase TuaG